MSDTEFLNTDVATGEQDLSALVWLPGEFAAAGLEDVRLAGANGTKWMDINVPRMSTYFAPTRAGQLISIIGQSSMGKSLLKHYLEYQMALQLKKEKREDEVIFHVSVEEPVEDMAMLALARHSGQPVSLLSRGMVEDKQRLQMAATRIAGTPIVYVGESINSRQNSSGLTNAMNLTNCFRAIKDSCVQMRKRPAAIFIDYLQALPIDPRLASATEPINQRRLQVRSDIYFMRRAGMYFGCPMFTGVQAKQNLAGDRKDNSGLLFPKLPGMYDGEESSAIAQRSDRILSVWMPARSYPVGSSVQLSPNGESMSVRDDQMLVKVLKQRGNLPAGKTYMFQLDFNTGAMQPEDL